MVIIDRPYVSGLFLDYLQQRRIAVLNNEFSAAQGRALNLVDDLTMARLYNSGQRLYTSSENALAWVGRYLPDSELMRATRLMKDKAAMRRSLRAVYPQYFFREVPAAELGAVDIDSLPMPFVLKPSVGFFSLGVHTINNRRDWQRALEEIAGNPPDSLFPAAVISQGCFLLEEYIKGDEFAVDMYYDEQGEPVIVNILQHCFASDDDVSDRLYITSLDIINGHIARFSDFFRQINQYLQIKNFPAHVELRLRDNQLLPIEFNPLRFAGLCTTDIASYAYGVNTVDCYLNNHKPDFVAMKPDNHIYSMVIMGKDNPETPSAHFDYAKLRASFQRVLEMRKLDVPELPAFAIVFAQTPASGPQELDAILHARIEDFLL